MRIFAKKLIHLKPLQIRFFKIDGIIRIYDRTRYLIWFASQKFDTICNRIRYLINQISGIRYIFSNYFANIKVDSYDFLPKEKRLTLRNVIMHIKSVLIKDKNHYYYNRFLEKCSDQLAKIV